MENTGSPPGQEDVCSLFHLTNNKSKTSPELMKDMNTQTQRTPHRINLFSTLFPHRAGQGPEPRTLIRQAHAPPPRYRPRSTRTNGETYTETWCNRWKLMIKKLNNNYLSHTGCVQPESETLWQKAAQWLIHVWHTVSKTLSSKNAVSGRKLSFKNEQK